MREDIWLKWLQKVCCGGRSRVLCGVGDDGAVTVVEGNRVVLCSDAVVEGTHFLPGVRLTDIGHKALSRCLSDTAAMFGRAEAALVNFGVPPDWSLQRARTVFRGLLATADRFNVSVVGGDTVSSPVMWLSVTVTGRLLFDRPVLRSGARPGDVLVVTGRVGGAVSSGRHLTFTPRLDEAAAIATRVRPHAAIDLSDGLSLDAWRMARASGCDLIIERESVPVHPDVRDERMLCEGEDYELLMAIGPGDWARLERDRRKIDLHRIGFCRRCRAGNRPQVFIWDGHRERRWPAMGYRHGR